MIQALHNGASGMMANQKSVDTIANNIANVNTTGFVKSRVEFKDALYNTMIDPSNPESTENLKQGTGVLIGSITKIFSPGAYVETENSLDFAIVNEGFFAALNEDGEISFTRDGSFQVSQENGERFLVTSKGQYILDENMQKIRLESTDFNVDEIGNIRFGENEEPSCKIAVVGFENKGGLEAVGNNMYEITEASGEVAFIEKPKVRNKMLEGSNVNLTDEISNLIKAQRAYQMASKVISTADDMEALANNLRT